MSCCGPALTPEEAAAVSRLAAGRLSAFLGTLRDNAFTIGLKEGEDAAALMAAGYAKSPGLLRSALKHLLSARRADWERFDGIFDAFWLGRRVRSRSAAAAAQRPDGNPALKSLAQAGAPGGETEATDQVPTPSDAPAERSGEGRMEGASRAENIARTDFRRLSSPQDVAAAHRVAAELARAMRTRLTRRDRIRRNGLRLDMRRTIHGNISHGGVPIRLSFRRRREKPLRLVMLLDASGSMSLYTGLFLRFMHGVLDEFREAEAFLFHTRLAHVSDAMKERDAARALDRLSMMAEGAGGGTRIGACLAAFNRWHAPRVIHSRTCVMIMSDGFDTGAPGVLACEMRRLRMRCKRIVWLNPMIGWRDYEPSARGMREALPYVDLFAPAHNLESLAALEPYLARI